MSEEARNRLRDAFLSVTPATLKLLRLSKYVAVDPSHYEPIRQEMAAVEAFLRAREREAEHSQNPQGDGILW